jgi:hypothetical protein
MENNSKISYGSSTTEVLEVASKLVVRHKEDGEASPLRALTDVNWTTIEGTIPMAIAKQREAEEYRMKSDMLYRERDLLLEPIVEVVRRSKNLLKSVHSKNPKALSEWGFDVTYTTANKPAKAAAKLAKAAAKKTATPENKEE